MSEGINITEPKTSCRSFYETEESFEIDPKDKKPRCGAKIKMIVLEEDYYALTWVSLRESVWDEKQIRGIPIHLTPADHFWIQMNFITFVCTLLLTFALILWEVIEDKGYTASDWSIVVLRITLVSFAQKALAPEFFQGLFLMRYSIRFPGAFTHYEFAIFIGSCQFIVSCVVFCAIILFVCMEEEALTLVVEFAGLTVIAKLDNWLGEVVMHSRIHEDSEDNYKYNMKNFNKRIPLNSKIALIDEEDLTMEDDQNHLEKAHWIINFIEFIIDLLPWQYLLPFITVFFNYVLPLLKPSTEKE